MTDPEPLRHIDMETLPTDQLRTVWELLLGGQYADLKLWSNGAYVAGWSIEWLRQRKEGPVIFGDSPDEAEFCDLCADIIALVEDSEPKPAGSAIGAWLVKAMVLALLQQIVRLLAEKGILTDWMAEMIDRLKEQIEAL